MDATDSPPTQAPGSAPLQGPDFQVFAKPGGALCNLDCRYCYYLDKESLYPETGPARMDEGLLEAYILQHMEAVGEGEIRFSWHGGEPTLLGVDYFRAIVTLQEKHARPGDRVFNALVTNGTLLDEEWCRFLAAEGFAVGLSLDGPADLHDAYRVSKGNKPTHHLVMRGFELLRRHRIPCDILCVVNDRNVRHARRVYRFFKQIGATYVGFLPVVESVGSLPAVKPVGSLQGVEPLGDIPQVEPMGHHPTGTGSHGPPTGGGRGHLPRAVTRETVPARAYGSFLITIFDEWVRNDIGRVMVQIFDEAARPFRGMDHSLCIFRERCGDVPVLEHDGSVYSCDHFVDPEHLLGNIRETPLASLLASPSQRRFGDAKWDRLPRHCLECPVRPMCNGGCPKDRFLRAPDGEEGLNYLCQGLKAFFTHARPTLEKLVPLWKAGASAQQLMRAARGLEG
jgi:uncharacterized protein